MPAAKTETPEALRERASSLAAQAAEAQAEVDRTAMEEYERQQEEARERDRQTVAAYDRPALDRAVDEARDAYLQAVADLPVTRALADYVAAGYRRSHAHFDLISARSRLGLGDDPGNVPAHPIPNPLQDDITATAGRMAQAQIDAERNPA